MTQKLIDGIGTAPPGRSSHGSCRDVPVNGHLSDPTAVAVALAAGFCSVVDASRRPRG